MLFDNPVLLWFILGAALLVAELLLPGFILIFFGVAAWLVALMIWIIGDVPVSFQLITFGVASVLLILTLRQHFRRTFQGDVTEGHDADERIGARAVVEVAIPAGGEGRIKGRGSTWPAISESPIEVGVHVVVTGIDESNSTVVKVERS
ncbi:MAG: NfeD family protein [Gammaproteobacteria bacterium AqS3]|nr:NfeD family protein [Gammaproteobacteria bacterium AqS3]